MRHCIFCGQRAGSKEHIFPQWLIDKMDARTESIVVAHQNKTGFAKRPPHLLNTFVTKQVCTTCNNGWMANLEGSIQQKIELLVERKWPSLADNIIASAIKEKELLAKWSLKTLICIGCSSIAPNIVKPHIATDLYKGNLPSDLFVEIAHISEWGIGAITTQGLWVENGGHPIEWQERHDKEAFKAIIQLNHLAIRIFRCPEATPIYNPKNSSAPSLPVLCYPHVSKIGKFSYTYSDAIELDNSMYLKTGRWEIHNEI